MRLLRTIYDKRTFASTHVRIDTAKGKRTPMGLERVKVEGLQELLEAVEQRKGAEEKLFVLFCGSVRPETGESWCPDCVKGSLDDRIISV